MCGNRTKTVVRIGVVVVLALILAGLAGALAVALVVTAPLWRRETLASPYPALQWADAAACYYMAMQLSPEFVEPYYNLGSALGKLGRRDEAEAYCRWARRRLPTEAEWERAATLGLIDWGCSVWEWMADAFAPYPGFSADRYRD